jgi:serine/threonine protein kinase
MNCKIEIDSKLGNGMYGDIFITTINGKKRILKITRLTDKEKNKRSKNVIEGKEFKIMKYIYKRLHTSIPQYVINPIKVWLCTRKQMGPKLKKHFEDYDKGITYRFMIFNKLGDYNLGEFLKKKLSRRVQLETAFQVIIFLLYLRKIKVLHRDLDVKNSVVKKNTKNKLITFRLNNRIFRIRPQYFTYFIDYGGSITKEHKTYKDCKKFDLKDIWRYILYKIPVMKSFFVNKDVLKDDKYTQKSSHNFSLLKSSLFKSILK